jgi:GMP synthase (glutamine-hydrolysing)
VTTILVVQHEEECPPAWFGTWLAETGCELDVRRPDLGDDLSGPFDGLLVLGGHMGANDDVPWYPALRDVIGTAVADEVPTLGICLGHQVLAVSLGGQVIRNPRGQTMGLQQVGWTPAASADRLVGGLTDLGVAVQWNNDIVSELPRGAALLASTPDGDAQAIRFGAACWGVQWHPEADEHVVAPWADADRLEHGDARVDAEVAGVAAAYDRLMGWKRLATAFAERVRD